MHRRISLSFPSIQISKRIFYQSFSSTTKTEPIPSSWYRQGSARPLLSKDDGYKTRNIFLMGPPGSGKTSVGKELARLMNKSLLDIDDHWLEPRWQCSVASKLAELGDENFLRAEGDELLAMEHKNHIISLTGSNPLHQSSMEHLSRLGIFVYLDVPRKTILDRCESMRVDRIVGQSTKSLNEILEWRQNIYEKSYDIRVIVGKNETPSNIAQKIHQHLINESLYYHSTRRDRSISQREEFLQVVQKGLASDGGLYVPESFCSMKLNEIERLIGLKYPEIALRVMERFPLGTLHPSHMRNLLYQAYSSFESDVLPVRHLRKNQYLIETFNGPTGSFKDLSLQLLPLLMREATSLLKRKSNENDRLGLLVATSGDTGCAALDGFSRIPGTPVIVLYPNNGVSPVQQMQMQTASGDVCILGINADFDFCQSMVKNLFNDEQFLNKVDQIVPGLQLSSANSINWARFLPQIVFTISSYVQLIEKKIIDLGQPIDVCIPTGNFGNMLGAVYARRLGLPIRRLITASNENNIIADFLQTGFYDLRQRPFRKTISPSIDILISSNLERFLLLHLDGDTKKIRELFEELAKHKYFHVDSNLLNKIQKEVQGDWANETQCLSTIKQVYQETQQLIDPHTAVAVHVADRFDLKDQVPMLISATAHYGKFPETMLRALHCPTIMSSSMKISDLFNDLQKFQTTSPMHQQLLRLTKKSVQHKTTVDPSKSAIVNQIELFLEHFARSIK